jgi:ankyrin repeat protein
MSCSLIRLIQSLAATIYKNINSVDKDDATPLHYACGERKGNDALQLIEWLVSNGADVMASDRWMATPLHSASRSGYLEAIKWLVEEYGMDLTIESRFGETALNHAALFGHFEIVKWLVDVGGLVVTAINDSGNTTLWYSLSGGHLEIFKWLVEERGVEAAAKNVIGETVLHAAAT